MPFNSSGIVGGIVQVLFEAACFYAGKVVVPVVSFGRMIVEDRPGPWWNPFARLPDGRVAVSNAGASVIGFFVWIIVAIVVIALVR